MADDVLCCIFKLRKLRLTRSSRRWYIITNDLSATIKKNTIKVSRQAYLALQLVTANKQQCSHNTLSTPSSVLLSSSSCSSSSSLSSPPSPPPNSNSSTTSSKAKIHSNPKRSKTPHQTPVGISKSWRTVRMRCSFPSPSFPFYPYILSRNVPSSLPRIRT